MVKIRKDGDRFFNRELSWIAFNNRVLDQAFDASLPLLERLKFLSITASNLDEFFMVRVGGLQQLRAAGIVQPDISGMSPINQIVAINRSVHDMVERQYACYRDLLQPALDRAGIRRARAAELTDRQRKHVEWVFERELLPVLSPLAIDGEVPPPLLSGRTVMLAVRMQPSAGGAGPRFAVIPLGRAVSRFVTLPSDPDGYCYLPVEELIAGYVDRIFPSEPVVECAAFRVTRNADMSVREDMAGDLLAQMEEVLVERRRSDCVRLEIDARASKRMQMFLRGHFKAPAQSVYAIDGPLDLAAFMTLCAMPGQDRHRIDPWPPQPCTAADPGTVLFDALRKGSLLLAHPYDSFEPVLRFIDQAADDPGVVAIKQILYRTSRASPIIAALARAAQKGKSVTVLMELKARFDEERNIDRSRELEDAGVQVVYGVKGLKTHAKLCLVIRREADGLRRYMHFGTGNYNEITAQLYTDISYLTADEDLGGDASAFFNTITGYSLYQHYRKLTAAPTAMRDAFLDMIGAEIERKRQGQKAGIRAKCNSLADPKIIRALYDASQAGVRVELNIRGICCLRPGVAGLSENIRVISIVDRFLEHSRIYHFLHGGEQKVFISSADWMPRNLDKRVELLVPVEDPACRDRLVRTLDACFRETVNGWLLRPDGTYVRINAGKRARFRSQEACYRAACLETEHARQAKRTVFEPYSPVPDRK